jgi:L-ascorbate metabolism protein UlaG (beta-lactamase superfamily)
VTITLLRHATVVVEIGGERILVDPMLDAAGARGPVAGTPHPRDNPLVDLPATAQAALAEVTAAIVTHLHADHVDDEGARYLGRAGVPVFGQDGDLAALADRGVPDAAAIGAGAIGEVAVHRTDGRHGVGAMAERLGPVSGVVLDYGGERVYIAGDTVPCAAVDEAMRRHTPTTAVLNAGGARFLEGDPITMTAGDVVAFAAAHPATTVVAVHMDAINHCVDSRTLLHAEIARTGVSNVLVPGDGERAALYQA